ncbi:hypothetical protein [Facklamia hominis]|uniref:Uncharacterized protein n=1 Tax=Facklamia hominis CCUG 36813 TaxID=883111 RepID=K1LYF9_9LACT|nr:hypothetical protein [Facklamia hominis]EKB55088.1 hypothetical protein HMPREF9706_01278 [Facklamia hominis CCUG 36813]
MSIGHGAYMKKILEDESHVIYVYGSYNLNDAKFRNENYILDGSILVKKTCFQEPDIHRKIKRMPNRKKKLVEKSVIVFVDYPLMIEKKK